MIERIFPISLGRYNIERPFTNAELNAINFQERKNNIGNSISINKSILDDPALHHIKSSLETILNNYFNEVYSPKDNVKLGITQSWLNWTNNNQYHHKHNHSNSFISGVLYIYAKKETDTLMFYKDGYTQFDIIATDYHILNSSSWWVTVGEGDIVLFPSSLVHSVPNFNGSYTRLSLSFNTFLEGEIGSVDGSTFLKFK